MKIYLKLIIILKLHFLNEHSINKLRFCANMLVKARWVQFVSEWQKLQNVELNEKVQLTDDASTQIVVHLMKHVAHVWTIHTKTQIGDRNTHTNSMLKLLTYFLRVARFTENKRRPFFWILWTSSCRSGQVRREDCVWVYGRLVVCTV